MVTGSSAIGLVPPLRLGWRSTTALSTCVTGNGVLYGITLAGRIVALDSATGSQRWESTGSYLPGRLSIQGNRLVAYKVGEGLAYIDDQGSSATERLVLSFGVSTTTNTSQAVLDDRMVYLAVNRGLTALHQDEGLKYGAVLSRIEPHSVGLIASSEVVVVDGRGIPTRYRAGADAFSVVWTGEPHGVDVGMTYRPLAIVGNRLVVAVGPDIVAYDVATGRIAWHLADMPARVISVSAGTIYTAFNGPAIRAIRASDGLPIWSRQYIYDTGMQQALGLVSTGDYLYCGGTVAQNPDAAMLLAIRSQDGAFMWLSRSATSDWAAGVPYTDGASVFTIGASHTGAYTALPAAPRVLTDHVDIIPRVLRGPAPEFEMESIQLTLPVAAQVSITAYRERQGLGTRIVTNANWGVGPHTASWNPAGGGGYTSASQFGYLLVDIQEASGVKYTQALMLPINTFPDVVTHWAGFNIEVMMYHKYVNGYEDLTFRPDALITRAESSTIMAKTLNLSAPSPGFRTRFTDLGSHWARSYIMALEERGIVGGFREPDGTYTFRPDLNMTRAEEARVLVGAYVIPAAPAGFVSKFTDIAGHWAEPDIRALESAGYVNGFQEFDGTFTYRPEQNLTRAELCTVVVRIRDLSR
jgi:outer membrane protein assembly factor BamB